MKRRLINQRDGDTEASLTMKNNALVKRNNALVKRKPPPLFLPPSGNQVICLSLPRLRLQPRKTKTMEYEAEAQNATKAYKK